MFSFASCNGRRRIFTLATLGACGEPAASRHQTFSYSSPTSRNVDVVVMYTGEEVKFRPLLTCPACRCGALSGSASCVLCRRALAADEALGPPSIA
eukprot:scaffold56747_cov35-Tisochrysis_lutea.AAC.1